MTKKIIQTDTAPQAIGTYSQAVVVGNLVFISGQIPLDPQTGDVISGNTDACIRRVLDNVSAICTEAGGTMDDIVKLTVYLTDLSLFARFNEIMAERFSQPYPARAAVGVAALPKGVQVEADAIMALPQ